MSNHSIKLSRARKLSSTGRYPATYDALSAHIPDSLVGRLTASELADAVDTLYRCAQQSKCLAAHDAISDGGVWDASAQRFRELA